jgi:transcriptional regulator GlxA family with amidase domain
VKPIAMTAEPAAGASPATGDGGIRMDRPLRELERKMDAPAGIADARLLRAIIYIHTHLAEPVSIDDIARAAGVSVGYFTRLFKKLAGMPPRRYLTEARFERAKELLRKSEKNLAQVAAETGFADQSHLTQTFRRHAGTTAKAFRES